MTPSLLIYKTDEQIKHFLYDFLGGMREATQGCLGFTPNGAQRTVWVLQTWVGLVQGKHSTSGPNTF